MENLRSISDQNLYHLCKTYGARVLEWRRKFIGLLPEVYKRKLFAKKGFGSIFEFAKKLAGLSEEQVRRVLNLEKKFEKMPVLKSLLVNGEVSMNKLARVASIANHGNQEFLAGKVRILSQDAVETLVRDESWARKTEGVDQNGLFGPGIECKSVRAHTLIGVLNLSPDVQQKLLELQQKGIDINNLLLEFLNKREGEIEQKKEEISKKVLQKEQRKKEMMGEVAKGISRYRPVAVRNILKEEFGTKCSINNCKKLATTIHHTQRFSISGSHDPRYLAPLCKDHHQLAHAVDVRYQEIRNLVSR